jgi:hypothetical protein
MDIHFNPHIFSEGRQAFVRRRRTNWTEWNAEAFGRHQGAGNKCQCFDFGLEVWRRGAVRVQSKGVPSWFPNFGVNNYNEEPLIIAIFSVTTIVQLRNKAAKFVEELKDRDKLSAFYRFVFTYAKSAAERHLKVDAAIEYWKLVLDRFFGSAKDNRLQMWYMFLKSTNVPNISQDTWNLLLPFLWETDPELSNYDFETGPW